MKKLPTIVLGLSYGHGDSAAAIIVDGKLVAAAEEERFTRVKHDAGFPFKAIEYCFNHTCITAAQVHTVAIPSDPSVAFWKKLGLVAAHPKLLKMKFGNATHKKIHLKSTLESIGLGRAKVLKVEHHLAHMMSSRILTKGTDGALLSLDGLGDFVSAASGRIKDHQVEVIDRVYFPHSLGFFYTAMTHYLGFPYFGDEFKLMGLSSFGKPKYLEEMRSLIRTDEKFGFKLNLEAFPLLRQPLVFGVEDSKPVIQPFYNPNFITQLTGIRPRKKKEDVTKIHEDFAKSVQARFEEVANHLLVQLYEEVKSETLLLSGGCAHNSVWVGKIPESSPFKRILVAPASQDSGTAVGAAAFAARTSVTMDSQHSALLGPDTSVTPKEYNGLESREISQDKKLIAFMVDELSKGKIIGLMRGRMEFGPRALGSRSILADPRQKDMKDRINASVKHRESFRPFAASVLHECQEEWFKNSFYAPTMEAVFEVKASMKNKIPAVVHADQTCRIQSVTKDNQTFFWQLLDAFKTKTGVPMLLNTSFNDSEPVVCTAEDALRCFKNCGIDLLVIGNTVFEKKVAAITQKKVA